MGAEKIAISLVPELADEIRSAADDEGKSVSGWPWTRWDFTAGTRAGHSSFGATDMSRCSPKRWTWRYPAP